MKAAPLVCVFAALCQSIVYGDILEGLSEDDQAKVKEGKQVFAAEPLDGYPWPRVRVYQAVNATPAELMAVFFDYANAKEFVPNCEKSEISKVIDSRTFEVDYVVSVPIFPDEAYTVRNQLARTRAPMKVEWEVLRATSILESVGSFVVEPMGDGAVFCYTNLVKPGTKGAGLLKGIALGQMRSTVSAIVDRVEKQKADDPAALAKQMERLEAALAN